MHFGLSALQLELILLEIEIRSFFSFWLRYIKHGLKLVVDLLHVFFCLLNAEALDFERFEVSALQILNQLSVMKIHF